MTKIYSSAASYNLHASSVSRKQVDLQLDSTFHQPMSLSVDTTISVAFLPTHLASVASGSASALYKLQHTRHREDRQARRGLRRAVAQLPALRHVPIR